LAAETRLPAVIEDTDAKLAIKGGDWGGYSAIGAAMKMLEKSVLTIDLAAKDRITPEERRAGRNVLILGLGTAAMIALSGLFGHVSYYRKQKEMASVRIPPEIKAALQGMNPSAVDGAIRDMRAQLDKIGTLNSGAQLRVTEILREVVDAMPENVWLVQITLSRLAQPNAGGLALSLEGRARGAASGEEQELAHQFTNRLAQSAGIGKAFDVSLSLQGSASDGENESVAASPEALAQKLSDRTQFTVELKRKRDAQ
jgi:hypothetical protein